MKDKNFAGVVEALYVLARLRIIHASVDMLEHVQIRRNVLLNILLHFVHEVNIPEVPRSPCLVFYLQTFSNSLRHHIGPVSMLQRHDDLVDVEQGDVLVSEEY